MAYVPKTFAAFLAILVALPFMPSAKQARLAIELAELTRQALTIAVGGGRSAITQPFVVLTGDRLRRRQEGQ